MSELLSGNYNEDSDIDIAIKGCSPDNYFSLLGQLLTTLSRPVDLINLDRLNENWLRRIFAAYMLLVGLKG